MSDTLRGTRVELAQFAAAIEPWLLELGNWVFGALIGFNLVILGSVLTIGPVDPEVNIAIAAFAFALPPCVVGLVLLRLVADVRNIRRSQTAAQALHGTTLQAEGAEADREAAPRRRNAIIFRYTIALVAVVLVLTLVGLTAALWHNAWWIGAAFLGVLALSMVTLVLAATQLGGGRRRPRRTAANGPIEVGEPPTKD